MSHHGGHGYPKTKAIRQFNRSEAEKRQAEYDKLTLQEKIDRLPPEPHAKKQRARLLALLNKPVKVVEVTPEVEAAPIVPGPSEGQKARAKRLQKLIDAAVAGKTQPSSFREVTDRAANEARNESKKGSN